MKRDRIISCTRCRHIWHKRKKEGTPEKCPRCKSLKTNKKFSKGLILKIKKNIIDIHDTIIKVSGGEKGVRDEGGIDYSVYKLLNYCNINHPTNLGAFILNEFAKKHHFIDGNKRTSYVCCKMFMLTYKYHLKVEYSTAVKFIIEIAKHDSKITFEQIKKWLDDNCHITKHRNLEKHLNQLLVNLTTGKKDEKRK